MFLGSARLDPAGSLAVFTGGPVGVSEEVGYDELPTALAQAERALEVAQRDSVALVRHTDLPGGFLGLLDTPAGTGMAGGFWPRCVSIGLARTCWLRCALILLLQAVGMPPPNRWECTGTLCATGIARIRELLPGDLDDPDYRAELWLALRMTEQE